MEKTIKPTVNRDGIKKKYDEMMANINKTVCVHVFYNKHRACWIPNKNLIVRFNHDGKFLGSYVKDITIDEVIDSVIKHNGDIHMCMEHKCSPIIANPIVQNKGLKAKYIHVLECISKYNWTQPKGFRNSLEIQENTRTEWESVDRVIRLLSWHGDTPMWHPNAKELIIKYYVDPSLIK